MSEYKLHKISDKDGSEGAWWIRQGQHDLSAEEIESVLNEQAEQLAECRRLLREILKCRTKMMRLILGDALFEEAARAAGGE